jgi:hypothetical protein
MMTVESIGRIRRAYPVKGESIRGIARRLRVPRQVVRRVIASETGEFHDERSVQPLPKFGSHVVDLDRLLEENERRPRRGRLTLMRIWEELRGLGSEGGYDTVCRNGRQRSSTGGRIAVQHDPISKAKYQALRARGHGHARALRSVADGLLYVACTMLENGTLFEPLLATKNSTA